jgi:hypothetical protein
MYVVQLKPVQINRNNVVSECAEENKYIQRSV